LTFFAGIIVGFAIGFVTAAIFASVGR